MSNLINYQNILLIFFKGGGQKHKFLKQLILEFINKPYTIPIKLSTVSLFIKAIIYILDK